MSRTVVLATAVCLAGLTMASAQVPVPRSDCLHERAERPAERARRQRAIQFVQLVNRAEAIVGGPIGRGRYRPLEDLSNIPPVPDGFHLQFHTDGATYTFSLKDQRDSCGYSIFSDQENLIYEAMPSRAGGVVPALTEPPR